MNNGKYNIYPIYTYAMYLGERDVIKINPYAIQLFHRV